MTKTVTSEQTPRVLACCGGMVIFGGLERMMLAAMQVILERGGIGHCVFTSLVQREVIQAAERIGATWSIGRTRRGLHGRGVRGFFSNLGEICRASARLLFDAILFRPTHILVPEFTLVLEQWLALLLLRISGKRIILALQNAPLMTPFYARLWRWIIDPAVETYVCASEACRRPLVAFGIPRRKLQVVYNTPPPRIPVEQPVDPKSSNRIIFVGQIIPGKGLDLLFDALRVLVTRGHDVTLDVVGKHDGWIAPEYASYRELLFRRAAQPDLAHRVRFLGHREDVPQLMAAAAVHCIPSRPEMCEGFGIVVAEAKQAGIPSVAFNHGPFPELIEHGQTGWLCADQTPRALADGLEFFLSSPERLQDAADEIKESADKFSLRKFVIGWASVFALDQPA